jgi:hypothetical protein
MSGGMTAAVLVGAVALIGTVYALYRRGVFGGSKSEVQTPVGSAKQ